ncbi:MAG: twin transmembrane helix small protein [Rhodospirillales bacterium]|jgi:hypothetical protein|nr:twin transmembrane helix small protein [Acidimicrobiia bacterium]MBM3952745.1 twin transmembrane helix small protein [Rhodospirillales bacterium]
MAGLFPILLVVALGATLAILLVGIGGFAVGGRFNARHGNRLMRLRVAAQAIAVALIGLSIWLGLS